MRFAVLDLGSSSFQLLVADATDEGAITPILRERERLNLGLQLAGDRRISPEAAQRAAATVRLFRDLAARTGADHVLPVATSWLRDAANRAELERALEEAVGAPVRLVDGVEEGWLAYTGIRASVAVPDGAMLALDLGGGSLELAVGDRHRLEWATSLPLGSARISAEVVSGDPVTRSERREIRRRVRAAIAPALDEVLRRSPEMHVACGGAVRSMARLLAAARWSSPPVSLNQFQIPAERLSALARELGSLRREERLQMPGMDERRVDLLPAGSLVLATVAEAVGAEHLVVSEWGLREGVILECLGLAQGSAPDPVSLRRASVDQLSRAWSVDEVHGRRVAHVAVRLFDETAPLHGLDATDRELLEMAGRIHDVGVRISTERHHKHGAYIVEHAGLRGFSPDEVLLLASLVRFHRGGEPKSSYPPFASLGGADRRRAVTLVALLRVAHALARTHQEGHPSVTATIGKGTVRIRVSGIPDAKATAEEAGSQAALLAKVLGRAVDVTARVTAAASA